MVCVIQQTVAQHQLKHQLLLRRLLLPALLLLVAAGADLLAAVRRTALAELMQPCLEHAMLAWFRP